MVRAEVPVQVQRCLCSLPQDEHWLVYSLSHRQPSAFCLRLERRPLPTPNARAASTRSCDHRRHRDAVVGLSVQPLALSGETRCWLEWSTNFLAGCWCSTRSSLNFEICGAVPQYRFKISWSVPTYRLDWIVLGYSRCRPLAPPMSAEPPSSARVDRVEDTISHFYNVINELRERVFRRWR